jgi:hypothetical protein
MTSDDPRRRKPIKIRWSGMIGELLIDGESWGAIEWSDKRKAWCIEDAEGECLKHAEHVRGQAAAKDAAIELAEAMIRDGRMPTPEQARQYRKQRLQEQRARRAKQPSEMRRLAERENERRLYDAEDEAEQRDKDAVPLYEVLADAFDLRDPELWRSNSFAALRARLIVSVRYGIAKLERELNHDWWTQDDERRRLTERLVRAREILRLLGPDDEAK